MSLAKRLTSALAAVLLVSSLVPAAASAAFADEAEAEPASVEDAAPAEAGSAPQDASAFAPAAADAGALAAVNAQGDPLVALRIENLPPQTPFGSSTSRLPASTSPKRSRAR